MDWEKLKQLDGHLKNERNSFGVSFVFRFFLFTMASGANTTATNTVTLDSASVLPPPLPILLHDDDVSMPTLSSPSAAPTLERQIRDQYWLDTEDYMRSQPELKECEVLTNNYQWGWLYKVIREADGTLRRISKYDASRDFRRPEFMEPH